MLYWFEMADCFSLEDANMLLFVALLGKHL